MSEKYSLDDYIKQISIRQSKDIEEVKDLITCLRKHYTLNYIKIMYSWYGYGMLERLFKVLLYDKIMDIKKESEVDQ